MGEPVKAIAVFMALFFSACVCAKAPQPAPEVQQPEQTAAIWLESESPEPTTKIPSPATEVDPVPVIYENWNGRCPVCERNGMTSRVECGWALVTLAWCADYYDEAGQHHQAKCNTASQTCTCSHGHTFVHSWASY